MRAREETYRILEAALSIVSSGTDEAEVSLGGGDLGVTRFAGNEVRPAAEQSIEVVSVRIAHKGKISRFETTDLSTLGIKEAAQQARSLAEHAPTNGSPGLPEPQSYDLIDAYDPDTELYKALDRTAFVGRAILPALKSRLTASGFLAVRRGSLDLSNTVSPYAIANTRGLLAYHPESRARFAVSMVSESGSCGFAEYESCAIQDIDAEAMIDTARMRALLPGPARVLSSTTRLPVVLEPAAVASLVQFLGYTAGAGAVRSGASFLCGRLGERITSEAITIVDDCQHELHRGAPFDAEGVARKRVPIIEKGVAGRPVYSWESAVKEGKDPTGHGMRHTRFGVREGASHLVMRGTNATVQELIRSMKKGLVITRVSAPALIDPRQLRIQGMTGGLLVVEKGEIVAPAKDMGFCVNLLELLSSVEAISRETWADGAVVPAIRVPELSLIHSEQ